MATPTTYEYTKLVDITRLSNEIAASTISTVLDHMVLNNTDLYIIFKDAISEVDKTTLDGLVSVHVPTPIPNPIAVINIASIPAFAAKTMADGKKLYKRVVGIRQACTTGDNTVLWTNTFNWVKFMAVELIGGETGDYVSFYILDTSTGTYSGYPNATLNQFGFTSNVAKDYYTQKSEFDADVYLNLQVKMVYHSVSDKTVGFNFIMNEVKS